MRIEKCLAPALLLISCVAVAGDPWLPPAPKKWDPKFFESTMKVAHNARDRGDRHNAERLCAIAIPFVERSVEEELSSYANLLMQQTNEHAAAARANAQRYAEVLEMHAHATEPGSAKLGFEPFAELNAYADLLERLHRQKDAANIRALAIAQRQSQEAYLNRTLLLREGKDPSGEC